MIPILYEDKSIIVCQKPPGILSQGSGGESLITLLAQPGGPPLHPVHRLDRMAGGVMVCAKTSPAAAALSRDIQAGKFQKEYLCVTLGCPDPREGTYRDLLLHDRARNKTFIVQRLRGGVKEAVLDYLVLARDGEAALVWVRLRTGRTHQIRAQFAGRGTPLLGDGKYGGGSFSFPMALWSYSLSFSHPENGREMGFSLVPSGEPWGRFDISL